MVLADRVVRPDRWRRFRIRLTDLRIRCRMSSYSSWSYHTDAASVGVYCHRPRTRTNLTEGLNRTFRRGFFLGLLVESDLVLVLVLVLEAARF